MDTALAGVCILVANLAVLMARLCMDLSVLSRLHYLHAVKVTTSEKKGNDEFEKISVLPSLPQFSGYLAV